MSRSSGVLARDGEPMDVLCLHDGEAREGFVETWEDREAGLWGYTCHCGKEIEHDILSPAERVELAADAGYTSILLILRMLALVLIVSGLLGANLHLSLIGLALLFLLLTVRAATALHERNDR